MGWPKFSSVYKCPCVVTDMKFWELLGNRMFFYKSRRGVLQGSHGIEKLGKSRGFVIVFFPGLEIGNFLENREISWKVGKKIQ